MFYDKDKLFHIFQIQFKDKNIPDEVLNKLAEHTHENHFAIKHKEVDSILFLGVFEHEENAKEKITEAKYQSFIYDHYLAEFNDSHYLFEYWIKPFD